MKNISLPKSDCTQLVVLLGLGMKVRKFMVKLTRKCMDSIHGE